MAIEDIIMARRTIHNYVPAEISKEIVANALAMALHAPNHKLTFPWSFVVCGPATRRALVGVSVDLSMAKGQDSPEKARRSAEEKMLHPATMVAFCLKKTPSDPAREREDYAALACAVQNFSLYLWEQGFGTKWSTGQVTRDPRSYQILGVDPSTHEICGFVWVGIADGEPMPRKRPKVEDVVRFLP